MVALRNEGVSLRAIAADMKGAGHYLSHEGVKKIIRSADARNENACQHTQRAQLNISHGLHATSGML